MWTRKELKSRAKRCLSRYYWVAFLGCFLAGLLGASDVVNFSAPSSYSGSRSVLNGGTNSVVAGIILMVATVIFLISLVLTIFVGNVVSVGLCRFFMESREIMASAGVGKLFFAFSGGKYWNVVKTMFMRDLIVLFWTFLFIIPGIVEACLFYMVPYILSENPDMEWQDVLDLSRQMMQDLKLEVFILDLSFLGWYLLGTLLCGIGVLFVNPYMQATGAELYAVLRNRVETVQLHGFGAETTTCI